MKIAPNIRTWFACIMYQQHGIVGEVMDRYLIVRGFIMQLIRASILLQQHLSGTKPPSLVSPL